MPKYDTNDELGKKNGKYDTERVGLFSEMPYLIGDKYKKMITTSDVRDMKKSQMYPGILKTKTGLQDAYFDPVFKMLYEKEKWKPPYNTKDRSKPNQNVSTQPFIPSGSTKLHSTPGDHFGTFGPKHTAMSTLNKPTRKKVPIPRNIQTKPTNTRGPGYADICLNPFPEFMPCPYDPKKRKTEKITPFLLPGAGEYFETNPYHTETIKPTYNKVFKPKFKGTPFIPSSPIKNVGNGFDRWPKHLNDRYIDPYRIGVDKNKRKMDENLVKFYPQFRNKTFYTTSTMQRKLKSALNNNNWRTFEPITYPINNKS